MRLLRVAMIGVVAFGVMVLFCGVSFAQKGCYEGKGTRGDNVKLLKDSAAALEKSNPDLAQKLNDCADKGTQKMQEWKTQHDAKVKLLKDAAAALAQSNPDLAKGLSDMAEGQGNMQMHKMMMQEKNEKQEMGEKTGPAADK